MTTSKSPGPFPLNDDRASALYTGHLAARAEISLPGASRECHLALTWIASHVASLGVRLWTAQIDDIVSSGADIGSWKLSARTLSTKPKPITIERHSTLVKDGIEVASMSTPFMYGKSPEEATESILDFSVMTLANHAFPKSMKIEITDMNGLEISISLSKAGTLKEIMSNFSKRFQ